MWSIIFLTTGFIFLVLLLIIFLSKEVIDTKENKYFKLLLFINGLQYLVEIPLQILTKAMGIESPIVDIFLKFYLIAITIFVTFFSIYTFIIGLKADDPTKKERQLRVVGVLHYGALLFYIVMFFILPAQKFHSESVMYAYGPAVDAVKLIFGVYMLIWVILLLTNIKYLKNKKFLPILLIIVFGIANAMIQSLDPSILITTVVDTFICYSMFFTIENPDLKLIRELEVAREQADKANRAKTDFLSSMSHEIRTPLNAIVGFSDCIADAKNLGEAQENAKDIVNASQTLLEIVNGILDISKIEAGKLEIINTKYDAPETFEDLAKLITPRMNEKGLDFSYSIAPDLPKTLFGDHANIKKIVTNLLSNACKYTDKGFVHYEVNCINSKNVSKLIISVEDSGRGIRKESIDKMFTKFQRLDEDRNTTIEGTGLGLAITKQLIEMMGGRIIVHTVYGQGSKFTVVLNQKITQADVATKKVKTTLDLTGVRILMVDDTPLNLKVGCKLLEKYNANHIITSPSGFDCIDRINRGEVYDVILLDDMMPKMSGVETLKKLKENPNFKIPTVALTANAITGMREKYLADGFDDYLAKPIEQSQLIQVMNQVLGRSATEDINVEEVNKTNEENIRNEEIPNVADQEKAEGERENNNEENPNPDIIPVEDNIEEILGDQLDMNYREKTMTNMAPIQTNIKDEVEILDDQPKMISVQPVVDTQPSVVNNIPAPAVVVEPITPIQPVNTIPLVNVGPIPEVPNMPNLYDKGYLESNGVDVDHALELLGDMDMYNMTISDFVNDVESKWNKIVEYKNTNNMPEYAIEVHSLKSDCKYLGFMKLADISYQHELKSKENDSEFVNSNFDALETEYKKVLNIAKEYVSHNVVEG